MDNDGVERELNESEVISLFESWNEIIKSYNEIELSPDDQILKSYEEEFYADFEIIDENSDTEPFNLDQQLFFEKALSTIEVTLIEENNPELKDVIADTKKLKENLTKETKKSTVTKFSKILSKIRKIGGLKVIKEIISAGKKELYKRIISGSLDGLEEFIPLG